MSEPIIRQPLTSKKNDVYREKRGHQDVVVKHFSDSSRFQMEKQIAELLAHSALRIPACLAVDEEKQEMVYAYVNGRPAVDLIEEMEFSQAEEMIRKIAFWLADFYAILRDKLGDQYIMGDIHLRNFLYKEASQQVYGFDFEECRPGRMETDAARLYVFMLHYDPAFTERKKALAACLWETLSGLLQLNECFFQQEVNRETEELMIRRRQRAEADGKQRETEGRQP